MPASDGKECVGGTKILTFEQLMDTGEVAVKASQKPEDRDLMVVDDSDFGGLRSLDNIL